MKGYKGMDGNMQCRGMQFEVGKTYRVDGEIKLCRNGLHFCEKLQDVFGFYDDDGDNRFFEIEAQTPIESDGEKSVTAELTVVRELMRKEVNRVKYGYGYGNGNGNGYGNGYGNGDGYGDGNGYGYGYGYGNGYGNGDGYGDGNGNGYGYGYGYGNGDGYGNGYGYGYGYGNGDGYGKNIQKILTFEEDKENECMCCM